MVNTNDIAGIISASKATPPVPAGVYAADWTAQQNAQKTYDGIIETIKYVTMYLKSLEATFYKTKIISYQGYDATDKWVFTTQSSLFAATLSEPHYFTGIKYKGLRTNPITQIGPNQYQISESLTADFPVDAPSSGYVYSQSSTSNKHIQLDGSPGSWWGYISKVTSGRVKSGDFWLWSLSIQTSDTGGSDEGILVNTIGGTDMQAYYNVKLFLKAANNALKTAKTTLDAAKKKVNNGAVANGQSAPNADATATDTKGSAGGTGVGDDTKAVIYNLPSIKENYFKKAKTTSKGVVVGVPFVSEGDTPRLVHEASNLWTELTGSGNSTTISTAAKASNAHKGMIQSYIVPGKLGSSSVWWKPNEKLDNSTYTRNVNYRRYGFQFIYNPSTVRMSFAGAPQVDIGLELSGADKVPLIGSSVTSSTITFDLLINRMQDMKYVQHILDSKDGTTAKDFYPHLSNHPVTNTKYNNGVEGPDNVEDVLTEIRNIRDLGTMYDVEYLLRTLIGYQLRSPMRGDRWTADVGYLGAYPVELHLGSNLRYVGTISSFDLDHTIFTKDMVPVFTNMSITFNRLPDFTKPISGTSVITTTPSTTTTN